MTKALFLLLLITTLVSQAICFATWPSPYDELEDIKYLNDGYNSRGFAFAVTPCSFTRFPGRSVAGGFLRTAFHDMAPANVAAGTGGLDASIGFELQGQYAASNGGPTFNNTLTYYSRFFNAQASISDLIALGVYTAVRSCGGPIVKTRSGRVDATQAGALGVPDVRDLGPAVRDHFIRMGLTKPESIQIVACGHSLGGVHSTEFPAIVPANSTRLGAGDFDSTNSTYDNKVITEYLAGSTKNPLVVGPDVSARSDLRLFASDGNATVSVLKDPAAFQQICTKVLEKMIDTVPAGVKLTDPIEVYPVKPSNIQLSLIPGGQLSFSGQVRVRVNDLPKSSISKVEIVYKDRDGAKAGTITAKALGDASGFDDSFTFYGFDWAISAKTAISSFNVIITLTSGDVKTFDNNGKGFPVSDKIFVQTINSSLSAPTGTGVQKLNIVAAVRNGQSPSDLTLIITTINPIVYNHLPTLSKSTKALVKVCEGQYYTFYSASADIFTNQVNGTKYDVSFTSGGSTFVDSFNGINTLPSTAPAPSCDGGWSSSTTGSTSKPSTTTKITSTTSTSDDTPSYTTTVVTRYTTFCPFPTTFSHGTKTFTVTTATTLTITDCPCTIRVPWPAPEAPTATVSSIAAAVPTTTAAQHGQATTVTVPTSGPTTKPAAVATFTGGANVNEVKRSDVAMLGVVAGFMALMA